MARIPAVPGTGRPAALLLTPAAGQSAPAPRGPQRWEPEQPEPERTAREQVERAAPARRPGPRQPVPGPREPAPREPGLARLARRGRARSRPAGSGPAGGTRARVRTAVGRPGLGRSRPGLSGALVLIDQGKLGADRDRLVLGHRDTAQDAGGRRRNLRVDLVGGDLEQRLVPLHPLALLLEPARDGALSDALPELGHGYRDRHGFPDSSAVGAYCVLGWRVLGWRVLTVAVSWLRDAHPWKCSGLPASARCASPIISDWVGWGWISCATSAGTASQL